MLFRSNPRAACNTKRVPGTSVVYHPERGFVGTDRFTYEIYSMDGQHESVTVEAVVQ